MGVLSGASVVCGGAGGGGGGVWWAVLVVGCARERRLRRGGGSCAESGGGGGAGALEEREEEVHTELLGQLGRLQVELEKQLQTHEVQRLFREARLHVNLLRTSTTIIATN